MLGVGATSIVAAAVCVAAAPSATASYAIKIDWSGVEDTVIAACELEHLGERATQRLLEHGLAVTGGEHADATLTLASDAERFSLQLRDTASAQRF